ncbi:MAG: helix-turn-helix transcriptional regulator [Cereibacter sp.]|jgi:pimeloyl-ACP methyl ester carboxylesterase/DNA-binding CsgD family transcriptional regulator|nr:helix-turn-helix transcriptional regulator [Cereibacter sp.]
MGEREETMTEEGPVRERRAEIIGLLYEVALDPSRLGALAQAWQRHAAALPPGSLDDPQIEAHLRRASQFLGRLAAARAETGIRALLDGIPRLAAFVSDGVARIAACNRAAALAFRITEGAPLSALPFEPADAAALTAAIRRVASRRAERLITLRLRSTLTGGPVILRVSPADSAELRPLALVLSTELVWPEGFAETVQQAFSLTAAEVDIVRGVTLGLPIRDIAEARARSVDTVRTQMRSILAKTETHSQAELVRVVLGLMDLALTPLGPLEPPALGALPQTAPPRTLVLPDGRRLDWIEFGDPQGAACLYMPSEFGFSRWPAAAEREAAARGIRVIAPIRAGYGRSDPPSRGSDPLTAVTLDYAAVLDHLGLERVAVLALGADLRFAANLALLHPGRVTGILGCAARLPLRSPAQRDRLGPWQRFVAVNARSAPRMLGFLIQAAFALGRRRGKQALLTQALAGSAADLAALADPELREALLQGSEICLGARASAHEAFARDMIGAQKDWSGLLRACRAPILLLQGDADPGAPAPTIREFGRDFPEVEVEMVSHSGQLLFVSRWLQALDRLGEILPR